MFPDVFLNTLGDADPLLRDLRCGGTLDRLRLHDPLWPHCDDVVPRALVGPGGMLLRLWEEL